ncbi:hypothetical protein PINS_up023923 [Pythium insidiosum]|nr:hypothetical protein PINS_up023923 [Pythium insidiosum]
MVSWTHTVLRALFAKKDWPQVFRELNELQYHELVDGGRRVRYTDAHSIVQRHVFNQSRTDAWLDLGYTAFESCFGSEYLLSVLYANMFALRLVERRVLRFDVFPRSAACWHDARPTRGRLRAYWQHDVVLSSGAGALAFEDAQNDFVGSEMTRFTASDAALKLNRPMAGTVLLGSSARMLQYMSWYPDSYYSFLRVAVASDGRRRRRLAAARRAPRGLQRLQV